jgi:hypothetical protein
MDSNSKNIIFDKTNNKIIYKFETTSLKFECKDLNSSKLIGELEDTFIFDVDNELRAATYIENDFIKITFHQEEVKPRNISLKFDENVEIKFNKTYAIISSNKDIVKLQCSNCFLESFNNNTLYIYFKSISCDLEFFEQGAFAALKIAPDPDPEPDPEDEVTILTATETFVLPEPPISGPEFSLGFFDYYDADTKKHYGPLNIVSGVPVISTVPVLHEKSTIADISYFNSGEGADSKKIYLRAVCNQEISDQTVSGLIYAPNGQDTIAEPFRIIFDKISEAGQPSVYQSSVIFSKQDGFFAVDGFAYFAVYLDIIQEIYLPLKLDYSNEAPENFSNSLIELY